MALRVLARARRPAPAAGRPDLAAAIAGKAAPRPLFLGALSEAGSGRGFGDIRTSFLTMIIFLASSENFGSVMYEYSSGDQQWLGQLILMFLSFLGACVLPAPGVQRQCPASPLLLASFPNPPRGGLTSAPTASLLSFQAPTSSYPS